MPEIEELLLLVAVVRLIVATPGLGESADRLCALEGPHPNGGHV
jgi:hypothetical protein